MDSKGKTLDTFKSNTTEYTPVPSTRKLMQVSTLFTARPQNIHPCASSQSDEGLVKHQINPYRKGGYSLDDKVQPLLTDKKLQ